MTDFSEDSNNHTTPQLKISQLAEVYIREIAKWSYFLSIVGFIMAGLVAIMGLFFMFSMPFSDFNHLNLPGGMGFLFSFLYIAIGALYFFPCLYLFRSSRAFKNALNMQDEHQITNAFENQKSMFKFMGILTIIFLGFYAVMTIIGLSGLLLGR